MFHVVLLTYYTVKWSIFFRVVLIFKALKNLHTVVSEAVKPSSRQTTCKTSHLDWISVSLCLAQCVLCTPENSFNSFMSQRKVSTKNFLLETLLFHMEKGDFSSALTITIEILFLTVWVPIKINCVGLTSAVINFPVWNTLHQLPRTELALVTYFKTLFILFRIQWEGDWRKPNKLSLYKPIFFNEFCVTN